MKITIYYVIYPLQIRGSCIYL